MYGEEKIRFPALPHLPHDCAAGSENFPFCSNRCRLIDLGKWASGGYMISTKINDPEELEDLAEEQSRQKPDTDDHSSDEH